MVMRTVTRWTGLIGGAVAIGLAIVLSGVFVETADEGSSDLEIYIGEQIRGVVNDYLSPQLEFTKPDYQYPKTVSIENVRLIAKDPARDGRTVDLVRIRRATLELEEIPSVGQPLLIKSVKLDKPELRLLAKGPKDGSLIGFSNLLKPRDDSKSATTETTTTKLTDVLRIRVIELTGGVVEYDPRDETRKAMRLDNINTRLNVEPTDDGWYHLRTTIERPPQLTTTIDGRFNINDAVARVNTLELKMNLGAEGNKTLPPQLQAFVEDHQLQGELTLKGSGVFNFNEPNKAVVTVDADLRHGYATFDQYRIKIDKMLFKGSMKEQNIDVSHFEVRALDGVVFAKANVDLMGDMPAAVEIEAEHLNLSKLDRALAEKRGAGKQGTSDSADSPPSPLRGTLDAKLNAKMPLTAATYKADGFGVVTLKDGRLVRVPVLKEFEEVVSKATVVLAGSKPSDQLHVEFNLDGNQVAIKKIDLRTPALAVRGSGTVGFDGKLDLTFNGGPLEKVQNLLGKVGEITSQLTDKLAQYRVTGTVDEPEFNIKVAPGLFDGLIPGSN